MPIEIILSQRQLAAVCSKPSGDTKSKKDPEIIKVFSTCHALFLTLHPRPYLMRVAKLFEL
ncbi:hypothetical protein [Porticoccus sp. W117]|uniref:hypothetical protein n=1 Tax=Porticoccus sp. W117 TaxID=3054777 RepID=UPI0025928DFD|nr:hypothetical protein [Porticoccus sp. W117]